MKPTQQQSLQHAALVCLPLLASTTTWQVQIAMGICIRNGTGLHDLQGQIQPDPTRDYISVVILNVLLSQFTAFLVNAPFLVLTASKKSHSGAETFCLVSHQNDLSAVTRTFYMHAP